MNIQDFSTITEKQSCKPTIQLNNGGYIIIINDEIYDTIDFVISNDVNGSQWINCYKSIKSDFIFYEKVPKIILDAIIDYNGGFNLEDTFKDELQKVSLSTLGL